MESVKVNLPTSFGDFSAKVWNSNRGFEPVAVFSKNLDVSKPVLVRIHSECLTGDVFGSLRCDCAQQLHTALDMIKESGNGMCIYLRQEGRNIGLFEKMKTYQLQEKGLDTYEANIELGHQEDERTYEEAVKILKEFGVENVELLTNNPEKLSVLDEADFKVKQTPLRINSNEHNKKYIETKRLKFEEKL